MKKKKKKEVDSHTSSNIQLAFEELLDESSKLNNEYKSLKNKFLKLSKEFQILTKENEKLRTENHRLVSNSSNSKEKVECNSSKYEEGFQRFLDECVTRSKQASMIWGVSQNGKKGLGYKPEEPTFQNIHLKTNDTNDHSDCLLCTFCNKKGHVRSACFELTNKKDKFPSRTNKRGPKKIWVPKDKIVYVADLLSNRVETPVLVLGQWVLTTHDGRKAYVPRTPT